METKGIYHNLIQSLKLVASSPDSQIASLPDFVDVPDEIALIFNESFMMSPQLHNVIPQGIQEKLNELDDLFIKMSEDISLWSIDSMKSNELWAGTRNLGRSILLELNEDVADPRLDFIKWVK